ncbi:MAG: tRNA (adenosine(37)-N6)-threonylcarbamoyltransferase complex ATPase subunit type 1 TsaE [Synergistetes bacterium]|nr:tRNA (adenosine(37)-N6)-threonylcarbamoyltransferase complex ATPase subunit type 1 TsaE [Synergistota bacterium]MCX8128174.1 tRNA (adenosine(37)-N6)-threonylcarbamoyltransferase complex ATPase subunit type 1 TsaE [Synergistota bacterium]MDW8192550.1 tRNA (adenosine(37)-N6)-threonylcarbamoyltransferase complex ATPase subunit type 1 TsaE [Synergistota bacterium]
MKILTFSEKETERVGKLIASCLQGEEVIFLIGGLGVGKTVLARGIAEGAGVERRLRSSSFVLVSHYKGRKFNIYHVDLYRLEKRELPDIGLDEFLGEGVIIVEWADRLGDLLKPSISIKLDIIKGNDRIIEICGEEKISECIREEIKKDAYFGDRHLLL